MKTDHIYSFRKVNIRIITIASREIVESFVAGISCLEKFPEFIMGPECLLGFEESPKDHLS